MCGRFTLDPTIKFYERFKVSNRLENMTARYNIAPSQDKPGQRILYTSAEITDCVPPWNDLGLGLAERYTKMLTSYCV